MFCSTTITNGKESVRNLILLAFLCIFILGCVREVEVVSDPELSVSTDTIVFNGEETKSLYLYTVPTSETQFQVTEYTDWVNVYPEVGTIIHSVEEVSVSSFFNNSESGIIYGDLTVLSTAGRGSVVLKAFVGEYLSYNLADTVKISTFEDTKLITLSNTGNIAVDISINSVSASYLSIESSNMHAEVNEDVQFSIIVNREALSSGLHKSEIYVSINEEVDTINLEIEHFLEQKQLLITDVIDAEYAKATNRMIYISTTPMALHSYNPATDAITSIPLDFAPICVSVSPDGLSAVVGHDGHLSHVDLSTATVMGTMPVSCEAYDIVLAPNNWAYVFPMEDQWVRIKCIDLATEAEHEHIGYNVYAMTSGRLHPSGDYIYCVNSGDIDKLDIRSNIAEYMYDSPYHMTYPIKFNLWYDPDGTRIFTQGASVFRASAIESGDMLYNGTIDLNSEFNAEIVWLDYVNANDELLILQNDYDYNDEPSLSIVKVYNATNLIYKHTHLLEKFLVPDGNGSGEFYYSIPYFVFAHNSLNEFYVLMKAEGSGLLNEWAIQKFTN